MEKWKKKIIKMMYKQWMSKEKVSAEDIVKYFSNPKNRYEIYQGMLNKVYSSPYFKIRYCIEKYVFRFKHIEKEEKMTIGD